MDIMFTKPELATSLIFKSKKSEKPPLDKIQVERMLQYMGKQYVRNWDMKTFTLKANQKCRVSCTKPTTTSEESEDNSPQSKCGDDNSSDQE